MTIADRNAYGHDRQEPLSRTISLSTVDGNARASFFCIKACPLHFYIRRGRLFRPKLRQQRLLLISKFRLRESTVAGRGSVTLAVASDAVKREQDGPEILACYNSASSRGESDSWATETREGAKQKSQRKRRTKSHLRNPSTNALRRNLLLRAPRQRPCRLESCRGTEVESRSCEEVPDLSGSDAAVPPFDPFCCPEDRQSAVQ